MDLSRRQTNLIILIGVIALIGIFWVIYLFFNRGTLQVTGQTPYTIDIGKGEVTECQLDPCEFTLLKGRYTLKAEKEGYKAEEMNFMIDRGRMTEIKLNFEFIPMISVKGDRAKIQINGDETAADIDLRKTPLSLAEDRALRPLPDRFSDFKLSPNLKYAFFYGLDTEGETNYLLDVEKKSLKKINLGEVETYAYAPKSDTLYFMRSEDGDLQSLNKFVPGSITPVANFTKPISSPKIFISNDENFIIVYDKEEGEIFLVNTVENSREKILTIQGVKDVKFSPLNQSLLIGSVFPGEENMSVYSIFDLQTKKLASNLSIISSDAAIVWRDENNITYAVNKEYAPFGDALNNILQETLEVSLSRESVLVNYNIQFDKYTKIYGLESLINRVEIAIEDGEMNKNMVLFGNSEKVWEVKFGEIKD
ncbi:hypothetical protein HOG48_03500 [Candidatus Peregrinibacteria bacterium]|jgi:hypothetical protein|nr:hypothetical protein [Candidatus Peregrinibacteria bacterium]